MEGVPIKHHPPGYAVPPVSDSDFSEVPWISDLARWGGEGKGVDGVFFLCSR